MTLTFLTRAVGALVAVTVLAGCSAAATPAQAPPQATRTVEHTRGPIEIPADPQRIVVLDSSYLLDTLVGLGFGDRIVGRSDFQLQNGEPPAWLVDDVDFDRIELVGGYGALDVEAIAALRPDLIVGFGIAYEQSYEALSRIAPALVPDELSDVSLGDWRPLTLETGRLLDRQDRARELVATADAHLAERSAAAPAGFADRSLTVLTGSPVGDFLSVTGPAGEGVTVLGQLGFRLNPNHPGVTTTTALAPENYGSVDADTILLLDFSAGTVDFAQVFADDPVLSAVPAVRRGDLAVVEGMAFTSFGPLGAIDQIDTVFDVLGAGRS